MTKASDATSLALLEFQSPTAAIIATPVPLGSRSTIYIVTAMFASFFVVAGVLPMDKVVSAQGKVVSDAATIVVQPLETAIVRQVNVTPGQVVHKGDLLARLDPTFAGSDETALQAQVKSLTAEVSRLQAEMGKRDFVYAGLDPDLSLQAAIFMQRHAGLMYSLETYRQKIASLEASVQQSQADIDGYTQRLVIAGQVETMRKQLEHDQVGSKLNSLAAVDNRMEISRSLANAVAARDAARANLESTRNDRDAFEKGWYSDTAQKLSDQTRALSDAGEALQKAKLRRQMVELRADQDATVMTVASVSVGSVMQSGDQFITMVPVDAPLAIDADVPGSEAGFVSLGDPVAIKFDTLNYTRYGNASGTVRIVSPDSYVPTDPSGKPNSLYSGPMALAAGAGSGPDAATANEPYYRTRISIDTLNLHDTPKGFRLLPGMPVAADVKVGKRTLLAYLMQRVLPTAMESMREPG